MSEYRAITLHRWWAHAVAHLGKRVENRTWLPMSGVSTLLIHAGGQRANRLEQVDIFQIMQVVGDYGRLPVEELPAELVAGGPIATSAVVAVATLGEVCGGFPSACRCGRWAVPRQFHWQLANVRPLPEPVPARGALGLWTPPVEVVEAAQRQLTEVSA